GQVCLIVDRWLHVLIPQTEHLPREAGVVRASESRGRWHDQAIGCGCARQCLVLINGLELAACRCAAVKRCVDWQTKVRARSFQVVRNCEGATDHRVTATKSRGVCKADAGLQIL